MKEFIEVNGVLLHKGFVQLKSGCKLLIDNHCCIFYCMRINATFFATFRQKNGLFR